ncbi:bifunctional phosphopantothenoylcysteine decarboxylase/phosphopantothenate--cysteine ligase CoaBC [Blochmannia endosymbiont of Camponotus sp.]|uniref:bifunctional phosphopantothenoylcysteine decarboxylase/phosphopantothenate--cysteine ligase CoaBC n=1 Tax=Blochmannia endosymbiont of Camponotus sp. TaxID=700220 RepID=UPI0020252811|nr:bifunctional phosphopantothenoylcysteine decarboxylase/phosphopantothenate--cysteine ligase CoaBC [Blochmannia endosymbiont of Camponotus sp.]URJ31294.1 bifunctional phosphopantothenoylcysteine decarboxylase/phosphopantothenate--cysteine ligase CoaBC [Blochmannia endosymbiont of Camponotus sp.]
MTGLIDKHIILGVSGGIAAYKTIDLVRCLKERGSTVRVIMTKSAKKFVTPLSLQTISCYPVLDNFFSPQIEMTMPHIKLAKWADLVLLAPATANLLARLSVGLSNDLLCSLCLATTAPIAVAPSMNQQMYKAIVTQANLDVLRKRGVLVWGPDYGYQACNDIGYGRMTDPKILAEYVEHYFSHDSSLSHLNIMITAGPTHEALDPVRFFTNYSSGKMGFAIAQAAADKGAKVTLITGPVHLHTPTRVRRINVISALDMKKAVMQDIKNQQIFISCAAVSDYRFYHSSSEKIKKDEDTLKIVMIKNPDIVSEVGSLIDNRPYVVGFAAETKNIEKYAQDKRVSKRLDLICANNISYVNQGFNSDNNSLYLFWNKGSIILPLRRKNLLAQQLINEIIKRYNENH